MNIDFWNRGKAKILILIPERVGEEQFLSEVGQYYGTFDWTRKWVKVEREGKNLKISIDGVPPQTGTFYRHTLTKKKGWIEGKAMGFIKLKERVGRLRKPLHTHEDCPANNLREKWNDAIDQVIKEIRGK